MFNVLKEIICKRKRIIINNNSLPLMHKGLVVDGFKEVEVD